MVRSIPQLPSRLGEFYGPLAGTLRRVAGGFARVIDQQWPRSDLACIPTALPSTHDVDADGQHDIRVVTKLTLHDANENGVVDRNGEDSIVLHITEATVMRPDAELDVNADTRADAACQVCARL